MQVQFRSRQELAPDVWEYSFMPTVAVEYVPGQYARFTFPFHIDDPRSKQHRTFTLSSLPTEPELRFIVRLDKPLSVFKQPLAAIQPGDVMEMDEPHGDAILPRLDTVPLVFVAQGIALASYLPIMAHIATNALSHPLQLFWAHRPADEPLSALIAPDVPHLTRHDVVYPDRLTVDAVNEVLTSDALVYLSGGQSFVETLGAALEATGTARERIVYDYYEGYEDL